MLAAPVGAAAADPMARRISEIGAHLVTVGNLAAQSAQLVQQNTLATRSNNSKIEELKLAVAALEQKSASLEIALMQSKLEMQNIQSKLNDMKEKH